MPVEAYRRHLNGKTKIIKCTILILVKNFLCSLLFLFAKDRRLMNEQHEALKHRILIIYKNYVGMSIHSVKIWLITRLSAWNQGLGITMIGS